MSGLNKVHLIGNLGKDPEVRYTQNGTAVASFNIATSESWKDKNSGEKQERTEWHHITLWSRLAEVAGEFLKKGMQVYIEGKLQTRKWTDDKGVDRYTTEIVGNNMQMLGGKSSGNRPPHPADNSEAPAQTQAATTEHEPAANPGQPTSTPALDDFNDDIPF